MSKPLLSFDQIAFSYRLENGLVIDGLSLGIQPGTVTALLGPNGAGKTTLLHLALGWCQPQSGRVLLDGKPLKKYSRRELGRWIGLVPQSEYIPYEYSLLEYVLLGRAPYLKALEMPRPEDYNAALQALETVGLGRLRNRSVTALSGGERQLVLVARALAQQPRLLLLDEPAAHLDLSNKIRLLDVLRSLVPQGVTILLTAHEPEVAANIATHLVLMRDGHVQHNGPLEREFTTERLSTTYGVPVQVSKVDGQRIAIWGQREKDGAVNNSQAVKET